MHVCDVMVHINGDLGAERKSLLEDGVRELPGVIASRFNPGQEHLMLVAFDPDMATTASLLASVRIRGYRAQLVGL